MSDLDEADFCQWLTREIGVAAIPLSAFYGDGFDQRVVRFCFAKKDETLRAGARAAGEALTRRSGPDHRCAGSGECPPAARSIEVSKFRNTAGEASCPFR